MKRLQTGFTLVELLVVISIIAILMGLLIPAVNAAREVARRNQCSTNVKNFALAAVQHENSKRSLPPYIQKFGVFAAGPDRSDPLNYAGTVPRHVKVGGFGVALLPWLDAQPTYEHWTQDSYPILADDADPNSLGMSGTVGASAAGAEFHTLAAPNLAIFQCPSNPVTDATEGRNSYISNNGMCWIRTTNAATPWGGSAGLTHTHAGAQSKNNGTAVCKYLGETPAAGFAIGPKMTLDDLKDGQGFTALFSENVQALPWYLPGFIDGTDLIVAAGVDDVDFTTINDMSNLPLGNMVAAQFSNGWVWHYEDDKLPAGAPSPAGTLPAVNVGEVFVRHVINGGGINVSEDIFTLQMTRQNSPDLARPSSAHVDGVNVAFADGATRFVTQDIDYRVYQAIMTPRGKSSDVPWPEFILTDELGE